jgi:hypothetical protein
MPAKGGGNNEMEDFSKEDLNDGLDHYWPETRVFPTIADSKGPERLGKRDVLLILKWKLGRIKDSNYDETVSDKNLGLINQWVNKASEPGGEIKALEELDKIPGIGLATATAILTVCFPEKFTIIDLRVLEMLELELRETDGWTAEQYFTKFLPKVKDQSKQWGCTLREADQALWGLSVKKQIREKIG